MTTEINTPLRDQALFYPSPLKEFWQAFAHNKGAVAGLLFMLLILFCALFAPWVAPFDPSEQFRDALLTPGRTVVLQQKSTHLLCDRLNRKSHTCS